MVQNAESGLQWLFAINAIKSILSIFSIFACGFVLQEEFGHPIKGNWYATFARSFASGFGFLGIAFIPSIFFDKYILQLINDLQIIDITGSLFESYFLMTMIIFYFPLFFVTFIILRCYNKNKEKKEDDELRRPLFK